MRALQHVLLGLGIGFPADAQLQVHRAALPLLERIVDGHQETEMLLQRSP